MNLGTFGFCITIYFVLHSLLADSNTKEKLYALVSPRYYRLAYNFISIVGLVGLLLFYRQLPSEGLVTVPLWIGVILIIPGVVLMLMALRNYDLAEFSGTYQLEHKGDPLTQLLNTKGVNAYVRHPLYSASFLLLWGVFLVNPTSKVLCFSAIASFYLIIGTRLEEKKLIKVFGEEYVGYQEKVGRFIPKF